MRFPLLAALLPALLAPCVHAGGVVTLRPPEKGFYGKEIRYQGIAVKASGEVSDAAMLIARDDLQKMLRNTPGILWNLQVQGAEMHLIGKDQKTSDLPEFRDKKGTLLEGEDFDVRGRGLGGRICSCAEENLLKLPSDEFSDHREICVHEFAHTILTYGLSEDVRNKVVEQYRRSLGAGLWRTTYAAKNVDEFFAELTMWYYGTEGDKGQIEKEMGVGKSWLRGYDPQAFRLLDDIYSGRIAVAKLAQLERLPASRESGLRSRNANQRAQMKILNATSGTLQVFWLDYNGKREAYGKVDAGELWDGDTFVSHPWVFVDSAGKALALFVAQPTPGFDVIRASLP